MEGPSSYCIMVWWIIEYFHRFYSFKVRGQLENETWSNIGIVWKPNKETANNQVEGGLTVILLTFMLPKLQT